MDHRALLASLTKEQRTELHAKSNRPALIGLAIHGGAIFILSMLIIASVNFWPWLMLIEGILIVFLLTLLHETIHRTAFATPWLNGLVARICGFLLILPPQWFTYFHLAHHRHTQDPENDPELEAQKPETLGQYLIHLSGVPVWASQIKTLVKNAFVVCNDKYVPEKGRGKIMREAQIMLMAYGVIAFAAFYAQWDNILYIWIIPAILGQPFLRLYLLAEHGRCPG